MAAQLGTTSETLFADLQRKVQTDGPNIRRELKETLDGGLTQLGVGCEVLGIQVDHPAELLGRVGGLAGGEQLHAEAV